MEDFLAWRDEQQQARPHTHEDVAVGLHQPDGYQGGDDSEEDGEEDVGDNNGDDDVQVDDVEAYYDAVP